MAIWDDIMETTTAAEDMRARAMLLRSVRAHIDSRGWSRSIAKTKLGVTELQLDDILSGRISQFSADELTVFADRVNFDVERTADQR